MMALNPTERFYQFIWVEYHRKHCFMIKDSKPNTWNFYKADTIGAKEGVRFIEMSALYRCFLR